MKTILLKLAGPMQAYGTSSHFETRHTDFYPSKSAIIGMVAGALGYSRDEDEKIRKLNSLDFGVRVDQEGKLSRDYHIARKDKVNGDFERSYVTNRYYLEDAIFLVAIGSEEQNLMNQIENALKNPYFQLFLGRRSLPPTYDYFLESNDLSVVENLKNYTWLAKKKYKRSHSNIISIYTDTNLLDSREEIERQDRVNSFSQKNRNFSYRLEKRKDIIIKYEGEKEHDAFGAIGE